MNIDLLITNKALKKHTLETLAEETKLDVMTISDVLNGKQRNFGIFTLEKICKALGVTLGDLFKEDDVEKAL